MQKYREKIKLRIYFGLLFCCLMLLPNVVLNSFFGGELFINIIMVAIVVIQGVSIGVMTFYGVALKDETYLKKLYIKENDERRQLIRAKTRSTGIMFVFSGLLIAMPIFGFLNKVIFFTLLGVTVFITIVMLLLKLYFNKKM